MTAVQATGARIIGTFTPAKAAATEISFFVTGFTMTVEDRPQIDITGGEDKIVRMVPGKRGVTTVNINARFDQSEIEQLNNDLLECGEGELKIATAAVDDCGLVSTVGTGDDPATMANVTAFHAHLMGYSLEATTDSAVDMTLNFLIASDGDAISQP